MMKDMMPKDLIAMIAHGSDFYLRFGAIDVTRDGVLVKTLNDSNCYDASSVFRKGGDVCQLVSKLDFAPQGLTALRDCGVFCDEDCGFDMYLLDPWKWVSDSGSVHAISYDVYGGGIDKIVVMAGDSKEDISVHIHTSDGLVVQLGNYSS